MRRRKFLEITTGATSSAKHRETCGKQKNNTWNEPVQQDAAVDDRQVLLVAGQIAHGHRVAGAMAGRIGADAVLEFI